MKIQILSDLHLEFSECDDRTLKNLSDTDYEVERRLDIANENNLRWRGDVIAPTDADLIVLAGDINTGTRGVEWAMVESLAHNKPIAYVMGNHEYYKHAYPRLLDKVRAMTEGTNVHVLNNEELLIDGVRILGTTLWTDYKLLGEDKRMLAMMTTGDGINDYRKIRVSPKFRKLDPVDTLMWHDMSRIWLESMLENKFDGKTVVITHMAPSIRSHDSNYPIDELSCAYVSDLEHLMDGDKASLWIHGHIHVCNDYSINGTRVICNPRGYYGHELVEEFDPLMVVEV